jgi:DNA-binding MarR family transcriptional regulator
METHQPDPQFFACRSCPGAALRRASRAITAHYERAFRGSGMRSTQFSLLAVLTQTGPVPVSTLAAHAGLERTTLTRNLRLLESNGWVRLHASDADQRVRQVEMTRAGRAAAKKGLAAWQKAQVGVSGVLEPFQLGNLASKLNR